MMLLQELITVYEELKKNVYIIRRGDKNSIFIKFKNDNFFHLVGLHKTNINLFIPSYIRSKDKKYKYIKKNIEKFNNILLSEIKDNKSLEYRVNSFHLICDLLTGNKTTLYNLQQKVAGSLYDGDYGLLKIYKDINCLFGLVIDEEVNHLTKCLPQSWMASDRINHLIASKRPIYMESIITLAVENFDETNNLICI